MCLFKVKVSTLPADHEFIHSVVDPIQISSLTPNSLKSRMLLNKISSVMKAEQGHHIVFGHKSLETCSQSSHNGRRRASCPSPIGNAIREGTLDVVVSRLCGTVESSVLVDHIVWAQDWTRTQKVSSFNTPGQGSDLAEHEEVCPRQGGLERIGVVSVDPIHRTHQSFQASVVSVFKVNPSIAAAHAVVEGSPQKFSELNGSWSIVCKKQIVDA